MSQHLARLVYEAGGAEQVAEAIYVLEQQPLEIPAMPAMNDPGLRWGLSLRLALADMCQSEDEMRARIQPIVDILNG